MFSNAHYKSKPIKYKKFISCTFKKILNCHFIKITHIYMFCVFHRKIDKYRKSHRQQQTNKQKSPSWHQQNYRIKRTQEGQPDSGPADANHQLCKPQNKLPDALKKMPATSVTSSPAHLGAGALTPHRQPKERFHLGNRTSTWKMSINADQEKD